MFAPSNVPVIRRVNKRKRREQRLLILGLSFFALLGLFPYFFMVLTSLKSNQNFVENYWGFSWHLDLQNYVNAWNQIKDYFITTFIVVAAVIMGVLFLGLLSGFLLARFTFFGRKVLFTLVGVLLMVPSIASLIPLFVLVRNFHMLNTIWVLIIPLIATNTILSVILFKNYIEAIPQDFFDCAMVFGADGPQIFRMIAVPLSFPIIGTVSMLTMISVWNEYFWPLLTITDDK